MFELEAREWLLQKPMTLLLLALAMRAAATDQFTPVVVSTLDPNTQAFRGTDGKQHVVYELVLTNANPTPATIQKIRSAGTNQA